MIWVTLLTATQTLCLKKKYFLLKSRLTTRFPCSYKKQDSDMHNESKSKIHTW